jgi:hypothetical protein
VKTSGIDHARGISLRLYYLAGSHGAKLMLVHIFRGLSRVFGVTENGMGGNLPSQFSPWTFFKSIELSRDGEARAGVDTKECLEDIEKHGFHITDAHVRITESVI